MLDEFLHTTAGGAARSDATLGIVHIPKTGGSAVRTALTGYPNSYLGPTYLDNAMVGGLEIEAFPLPRRAEFVTPESLRVLRRQHGLVMGHYGAQTLFDAGFRRIATQVREPRSRLLSLYRFWQTHMHSDAESWGPWDKVIATSRQPFEMFLASPEAVPATDNAITRQLLVRGIWVRPGQVRRLCQDALENRRRYATFTQRLAIIEWMADSERFVERVFDSVSPTPPIRVGRVNDAVVIGDHQSIGPACLARLEDRTHLDKVLLDRLMSDGLISHRSDHELDEEFEDTARRLAFRLV